MIEMLTLAAVCLLGLALVAWPLKRWLLGRGGGASRLDARVQWG